jgi:hypothetical protein
VVLSIAKSCLRVQRGFSAFHSARASIRSIVSKVWGRSSCPGTESTRTPASSTATPGEPPVSSTVKARVAEAATPGLSS